MEQINQSTHPVDKLFGAQDYALQPIGMNISRPTRPASRMAEWRGGQDSDEEEIDEDEIYEALIEAAEQLVEERAQAQAEAELYEELLEMAEAEAEERARAEAEAQAQAEAELYEELMEMAEAEAEERARAEAEAQAQAEAEAELYEELLEMAEAEAEERAQAQAEAEAELYEELLEMAEAEAEERAKAEAEAEAEAEAQAKAQVYEHLKDIVYEWITSLDPNDVNVQSLDLSDFLPESPTEEEAKDRSLTIISAIIEMVAETMPSNSRAVHGDVFLYLSTHGPGQTAYYSLNTQNSTELLKHVIEDYAYGSDEDTVINLVRGPSQLTLNASTRQSRFMDKILDAREGAYFPWPHKVVDLDLTRYGIYTSFKPENYKMSCFEAALSLSGVQTRNLAGILVGRTVTTRKIPDLLAHLPRCHITVTMERANSSSTRVVHYGNRKEPISARLGLIEGHYFVLETVPVTLYAIKHYMDDDFKRFRGRSNWNEIYKKDGASSRKKFTTSYKVIKALLANREALLGPRFTLSEGVGETIYYDKNTKLGKLHYDAKTCAIKCDDVGPTRKWPGPRIWADFETVTDGERHEAYLVCWIDEQGNQKWADVDRRHPEGSYRASPAFQFLESLEDNTLCVFHNLRYDLSQLYRHIYRIKMIELGNRVYQCKALYKSKRLKKEINLTFKDSYPLISAPLARFGRMFNLEVQKEVMPHGAYTAASIQKKSIPIDEGLDLIRGDGDKQLFEKNIERWGLGAVVDGVRHFDHLAYSRNYCMMDCRVLKDGYETFAGWMMVATGCHIDTIHSMPALADRYFKLKGCYEGVNQLRGVPRAFIQRCVAGGRVMTRDNEKHNLKGVRISDFDACSLYPSAMRRMPGLLKGAPKVLTNVWTIRTNQRLQEIDSDESLALEERARKKAEIVRNGHDGYFVEVKVHNLQKRRHFPLYSRLKKDGGREYTNDPNGETVFLDMVGLEDLWAYQDARLEIVRGYYFDEGRNPRIKDEIQALYDLRLEEIKKKSPMEQAYKLMMNGAYGKTLQKEPRHVKKHFDTEKAAFRFFLRHLRSRAKSVHSLGNSRKRVVKLFPIVNNHFNRAHCGAEILSMSKRIMNEVICLAEDLGLPVWYQDTDSIHIQEDAVPTLEKEFRGLHQRELIPRGDSHGELGQFHNDFKFGQDKGTEPAAVRSIFLGKKSYLDVVEYIQGGEAKTGAHIRMKGIPSDCLLETRGADGKKKDPVAIYEDLYAGAPLEVDLLATGRPSFKNHEDYTISTVREFKRTIRFP